jgi:cbb3-type cytochrome oxidase subunit 3
MSQTKQILLAFLIPFLLAVALWLLRGQFFLIGCMPSPEFPGRVVCDTPSTALAMYGLLIIGLFVLSLILPPLITWWALNNKRKKIGM